MLGRDGRLRSPETMHIYIYIYIYIYNPSQLPYVSCSQTPRPRPRMNSVFVHCPMYRALKLHVQGLELTVYLFIALRIVRSNSTSKASNERCICSLPCVSCTRIPRPKASDEPTSTMTATIVNVTKGIIGSGPVGVCTRSHVSCSERYIIVVLAVMRPPCLKVLGVYTPWD